VQIRRMNRKRDSLEDIFLKAMDAPGPDTIIAGQSTGAPNGRL
jgi:hypothetical protein